MIINKSNDNGSGPWGSGNNQNPWGKRPNSNGTPPDVDEMLRQGKDKLKNGSNWFWWWKRFVIVIACNNRNMGSYGCI